MPGVGTAVSFATGHHLALTLTLRDMFCLRYGHTETTIEDEVS